MRKKFFWLLVATVLLVTACTATPTVVIKVQTKLDETPRVAIESAYEPELVKLLAQTKVEKTVDVQGTIFTLGELKGKKVVLLLSGISMVNASANTQLTINMFNVTHVVFSGIAGGVNPNLRIGDVVVPKFWAQYQESLFARAKPGGDWDLGFHTGKYGNFGMMFPQEVCYTVDGSPPGKNECRFWFETDALMLDAAQKAATQVTLAKCTKESVCLSHQPQIKVGGRGVAGQTFVDNAEFREWVYKQFEVDSLDMESSAVTQVAAMRRKPVIVFRSLSDLAGGGPGENEIRTYFGLASDNSADYVLKFLETWNPKP